MIGKMLLHIREESKWSETFEGQIHFARKMAGSMGA